MSNSPFNQHHKWQKLNQYQWAYTGNYGVSYQVGVAHGASSGHLVIYCNKNIIAIDFNVLQSKKYSFFIDDELVDLSIEKVGQDFAYDCQINTNVNTPLNQRRRQENQEDFRLLMSGLIVVLFIIWLVLWWANN